MTDAPQIIDEGAPLTTGSVLSVPGQMLYHAVEDGELERLIKLERPIYAAISVAAVGGFLGVISQAISSWNLLAQQKGDLSDISYVVIAAVTFTLAISFAIFAFRGKSDAQRALEAIRDRPKIPLPQGHPAAPPHQS